MCYKLLLKMAYKSKDYKIKEIDRSLFIVDNTDKAVKFMEKSINKKIYKNFLQT